MEGDWVTLKTYQAYTMAEALAGVKRDLGADAVILHTRTFRRRRLLGLLRRTIVEVTATPSRDAPSPSRAVADSPATKPKHRAALRAYGKADGEPAPIQDPGKPEGGAMEADRRRTMRLAIAMAEQHKRASGSGVKPTQTTETSAMRAVFSGAHSEGPKGVPQPAPAEALAVGSPSRPTPTLPPPAPSVLAVGPAPIARRFILTSADKAGANALQGPRSAGAATAAAAAAGGDQVAFSKPTGIGVANAEASSTSEPPVTQAMQDELAAIKSMVGQVLQRQSGPASPQAPTTPPRLFDMYLRLIAQDISEELADQIINDVRDELSADELEDDSAVRTAVLRHLADFIPVAAQPVLEACGGRPLTIALVGPTGVGKTTTLAKLAASFKLRHRRNVGLVTADTYRIAAVEQLRTYANIIGLPLQVVLTPSEMRQAMHALSVGGCDVILVDTAGRSQHDVDRLAELKQFIDAANPHEVHLVLSSTASERVLLKEAEAFSHVGADRIVFTKLDEAVSFGMLVNVIRQIGKQLSFVTTGQEVPDHLEVGRAERLAELVIAGGESLRRRDSRSHAQAAGKMKTEGEKRPPADVEIEIRRVSSSNLSRSVASPKGAALA